MLRLPPRVVRMRYDGLGIELVFPAFRNVPTVLGSLAFALIFLGIGGGIGASAIVALDAEVGLRVGRSAGSTRCQCLVARDSTGASAHRKGRERRPTARARWPGRRVRGRR
jgi:hypothetical protein